jgi:hypothetical protein
MVIKDLDKNDGNVLLFFSFFSPDGLAGSQIESG